MRNDDKPIKWTMLILYADNIPGQARIDASGALHHIIIRVIECPSCHNRWSGWSPCPLSGKDCKKIPFWVKEKGLPASVVYWKKTLDI